MAFQCPWCRSAIDRDVVASLTRISQPAPCCGEAIAESLWQTVFTVLLLSPLLALTLYFSRLSFEFGHRAGSVLVVLLGLVISVYVYRFVPIVHGPGRGFRIRTP